MKRMLFVIIFCCVTISGCASTSAQDKQDFAVAKANFAVKNYALSFNHLLPLAEKGDKNAQYALGYLYYYGYGVDRNETLAMSWISKAAKQGLVQAIEAKRQLQVSSDNPFYLPKK